MAQLNGGYSESVDLSSENLGTVSLELMDSLAHLRSLKLNSSILELAQLRRLMEALSGDSCNLQHLGEFC